MLPPFTGTVPGRDAGSDAANDGHLDATTSETGVLDLGVLDGSGGDLGPDAATGCASDSACSDGLFCNGVETCTASHVCAPGTAPPCDDGLVCTTDACDEATHMCTRVPASGTPCDDGNPCTPADVCMGGACVGMGAMSCDDGNPCTTDLCDAVGCSHDYALIGTPCDDHSVCTTRSECNGSGSCIYNTLSVSCSLTTCTPFTAGCYCDPTLGCQPFTAGDTCASC